MADPLFEITVQHAGAELARYPLAPGEYTIGRSSASSIPIQVGPVSRQHARLLVSERGAVQVEDLASANGTLLDEQPITGLIDWLPGQILRIGDAALTLTATARAATVLATTALDAAGILRQHLPLVARQSQDYAIGAEVARGGMGAVLQARESATRRTVAMKVMLGRSDAKSTLRFIEEAQVTAQLEHPNIVPVHDLGIDAHGQPFYTMKLVAGITLKKVLELLAQRLPETVRKYPLGTLLTAFQKIGDALAFAHSRGVIHRDLKPANIMLGKYGEVLVMDWGLAKIIGTGGAHTQAETFNPEVTVIGARREHSDVFSTRDGAIMGTAHYMSPEQARGEVETLDARSDVFTLGIILYELLTLARPFTGKTAGEIVNAVIEGKAIPPAECVRALPKAERPAHLPGGEVPPSLDAIIRKALAPDKAARYPSVPALQADLLAYQTGFATSAESRSAWKQVKLLIKRNKAASVGIAAVLLVGTVLGTGAILQGRRANKALAELRKTAPTFFEQARVLTERDKLPDALEKIDIALTLQPAAPGFHAQRGNILQSLERFPEAADAYATALRLNPQEPHAAANVELSRTLAASRDKDGPLLFTARVRWRDLLTAQGRSAEAILAGRGTGTDLAKMLPAWQAKIAAWLGPKAPRLGLAEGGYWLDLSRLSLSDLSPLRGMPLHGLTITGNPHLKDLSPLADCPLVSLRASGITDLVDLSPLKKMKLQVLDIGSTGVRDLTPLTGMQTLEELNITNTAISDLTPIREAKLKALEAYKSAVRNLEPLRGQPLTHLGIGGRTPVSSLEPVGDAPLTNLNITDCGTLDLAHLKTRQLRWLVASGTTFDHSEVLAEMTELQSIVLPSNLTDPGVLRKLPHLRKIEPKFTGQDGGSFKDAEVFWVEFDHTTQVRAAVRAVFPDAQLTDVPYGIRLSFSGSDIRDLRPVRSLPIDGLDLYKTKVTDLAPLRGMRLKEISIEDTGITDVSPLLDMPILEAAQVPRAASNLEVLRRHPTLKYLGWEPGDWDNSAKRSGRAVAEFWERYDALKAGGK